MSKYKLVNWAGSMNISDDHFRQTENFFIDTIADSVKMHITNYNYGLLSYNNQDDKNEGVKVNEHLTGNIEVQLYTCNAVTASGFRIQFDAKENGSPLIKNYSPSEDKNTRNRDVRQWDIILSVDPFSRTPLGEPDPEEVPPRHPDSDKSYALYIMPAGDINTKDFGRNHLTIGRIRKEGDRYNVDTQYIPPCANMSAHPQLLAYYDSFASKLSNIQKSSKSIIDKIHKHNNKSDLAKNVQTICHDLLKYIARIYFEFRNKGRMSPPIEVVNYVSSIAHTFYVLLTLIDSRQKEEMLKYFYEWTDVSPGAFEELLSSTLDLIYKHDNIRAIMVSSEQFLSIIEDLCARLSRLEFIGQHKDSIVISANEQDKKTSGSSVGGGWIVKE